MSETNNGVEVLAATGGGQAMMAPGGGLSGGKLALATAETDDVLAGKTYYAGDKELKTGTLALADATATESDVASGKTFYAGDNTMKTGKSLGDKFKETFNNLSGAAKVLVWTNPNPNSKWSGGTINISGQHYAAYSIFFKRYATTGNWDGSSHIAVIGASCYGSANGYTRRVSVGNGTVWIDTPLNNGDYDQDVPYCIYGIKGTEL